MIIYLDIIRGLWVSVMKVIIVIVTVKAGGK